MAITTKIAISIDNKVLSRIDQLVGKMVFPNRSKAIQIAVEEKISKLDKLRLAAESAKLNKLAEQSLSDENIKADMSEWPEY